MAEPEHEHLDALAGAGDHAAWEEIFRSIYPRLRAFVARRADAGSVEDLVSETMTRAVSSIASYRPSGRGIEAWIFGISRRVVADHHRRAGRERRRRIPSGIALSAPDDSAVEADDRARLWAAFEQLPDGDRELLELRFVAGLSPEATAVALGKRIGAVRTAQTRAVARLRRLLEFGA